MRRLLALSFFFLLVATSCGEKSEPTGAKPEVPPGVTLETATTDFCDAFKTANAYSSLPDDISGSIDQFDRSSTEFRALGEDELAEMSKSFADGLRQRGDDRVLQVFLNPAAIGERLETLEQRLQSVPHVSSVTYTSPEGAYERFVEMYKDQPEFYEDLQPDELPASFEVVVDDQAALAELERQLDREKRMVEDAKSASFLDFVQPMDPERLERVVSMCLFGMGIPTPAP